MKNTKTNWAINQKLMVIALAAVIGFSACDTDGDTSIDTVALDAVIKDAGTARDGVETATNASEVPQGKYYVTQNEWDAFDAAYKKAVETKANPSSQSAVNTAKANLQAALTTFNDAKKDGSGDAITLSGTITVKNNGQTVPYVLLQAHDSDWEWQEQIRLHLTEENIPWEIITKPLSSPLDISFDIIGYDNDKYDPMVFTLPVKDSEMVVFNADVNDIAINMDLNFITISGTFNLNYNGQAIPSVRINIIRKDDYATLGGIDILKAGNNTPWSILIPPQTVDTDIVFHVVGFDGPLVYQFDQLFAFWNQDFGEIKVKNQNKSGIKLNLITISGTVNVTYNGRQIPFVEVHINESDWRWITNTTLKNPPANKPWSVVIPAYTSDTDIRISIVGKSEDETELFAQWGEITKTVKNTNVSGIALNFTFIELSGTVNVTYNGSPVPIVEIAFATDSDWLGSTELRSPSPNTPWSYGIPAFTSDTEVGVHVILKDENDEDLYALWWFETKTVKNTNVSGITLNPGNITDE